MRWALGTVQEWALKLGVRFSTSNPALRTECVRALDFWATVLDMEWHETDSRACAIQIVDGRPGLFNPAQVARAQLPGRSGFQGSIAFNPTFRLPANEQFFIAVHELGHVFGLPHNSNASSIMFYLNVDEPFVLDSAISLPWPLAISCALTAWISRFQSPHPAPSRPGGARVLSTMPGSRNDFYGAIATLSGAGQRKGQARRRQAER